MEAKEKIDFLINELNYHNNLYYLQDNPKISDLEYDSLLRELIMLEEANPALKREDSPTQKVGGAVSKGFNKVNHKKSQLSLTNAFSLMELEAFDNRIKKEINNYNYCLEKKFDGLTVVLTYTKGLLTLGATRGDGVIGEDVTTNIKTIKSLPIKLKEEVSLTLRGEVFMPKKSFEKLNSQREKENLPLFANPRNAASGSLRQLDSRVSAKRNLDIFIFNLEEIEGKTFKTHYESLEYLKELGFKVSEAIVLNDIVEVYNHCKETEKKRDKLDYEIDGMVIKINELALREELGSTSKSPKWAIAYKFSAEKAITKLKDITVQVGRTGTLTPVAELEGVLVDGSFVSRATLHNEDYISQKDIKIGDYVLLQKAGDVIPEIVEVIKEKRDGSQKEFIMPLTCPSCGEKVVRKENEAATKCVNPNCKAQQLRGISHFVSRDAMNIDGLGKKIVDNLHSQGFLNSILDIYNLKEHKADLINIEKMGEKSVSNLLKAIEESKKAPLENLIFALGINLVGKRSAGILSKHFKSMDNLKKASYEQLTSINEIGDKMAYEITSFFLDEENLFLIDALKNYGLNFVDNDNFNKEEKILTGLSFVVTGKMEKFSRNEIEKMILDLGAKASSSVSKSTSFLIAGEKAGSKLIKAEELGVKVISEEEFLKMLPKA